MKNIIARPFALALLAFGMSVFASQAFAQTTGPKLPVPSGPVTDDGVTGTDPVPPLPGPKPSALTMQR